MTGLSIGNRQSTIENRQSLQGQHLVVDLEGRLCYSPPGEFPGPVQSLLDHPPAQLRVLDREQDFICDVLWVVGVDIKGSFSAYFRKRSRSGGYNRQAVRHGLQDGNPKALFQ